MTFENFLAAFLFTYTGQDGVVNWLHFSWIILFFVATKTWAATIIWPVLIATVANELWLNWTWFRQPSRRVAAAMLAVAAGWFLLPAIVVVIALAAIPGIFRLFRPRRNRGGGGNNR